MSDLFARAAPLSTATLHEAAGRIGALPHAIKPLGPSVRVCGPALPVKSPAGDNLRLHHAIYAAARGEVLVVDTGDDGFGYWGEVMALAAQVRGVAGLVIGGGVRDSQRMVEMGFPVFASAVCIRGTGKNPAAPGSVGAPIDIGGVTINRGDLVLGDTDGVVVIPQAQAEAAVRKSFERDEEEADIFARLRAGDTTLDIYKLPGLSE